MPGTQLDAETKQALTNDSLAAIQIEWRCAYCPAVVQQRFSVLDPALMTVPALPTDWLRIGGRAICPIHAVQVLLRVGVEYEWCETTLQSRGGRYPDPMPSPVAGIA